MKRVARPSPAKAQALALAAIRETFEESGLLLGTPATEIPAVPKGPWEAFAQAKILPDLQGLYFIGRAITPPGRTRRFDARFFSLDASAIAHRIEGVTGPEAELVELVWMSLPDAKQLDLPAVTSVMLDDLPNALRAVHTRDALIPPPTTIP
jgi:8-oxo-dGTP pyrophosphatase MutT (NUDIX family)